MVVKVYGSCRAVSPQRVMLCLLEKGVEFELLHVDLDAMQHKTPEYLAKQVTWTRWESATPRMSLIGSGGWMFLALHLHPFGKVPYVEDGDLKLYESRAIIRYYAAKYENRGPQLLGRTLEERALVDQWLDVEAMTFDPLVFPIVFNLVILPTLGLPADASAVHSSAEKLDKVLDIYEQRLSMSKYLAGDEFTLADLAHMPAARRLTEDAGFACMFAKRKNLKAWWEDISSRPSLKKVVSMGGPLQAD